MRSRVYHKMDGNTFFKGGFSWENTFAKIKHSQECVVVLKRTV